MGILLTSFRMLALLLIYAAGVLLLLVILVNIAMVAWARHYMYASASEAPAAQTVIILGTSVLRSGALSAVFRDRVDAALALYKEGKVKKILVSGDNSEEDYNEVAPVRNYLVEKGVPDADIYLDHAGFDTYSTMYRARDVFKVDSAIISTQSFHLPRAIFLARMLGIDAVGIRADNVPLLPRNSVREVFAREKAVIDLALHRLPEFLGVEVPIDGKPQTPAAATSTPTTTATTTPATTTPKQGV